MLTNASVLIIDSERRTRDALTQAIRYARLVNQVYTFVSLDEALSEIRQRRKAEIVFVAASFGERTVCEFITSAKQTFGGRDGAFMVLFDACINKVSVARNLLHGSDGFIVEPFSVDDIESAIAMADKIRLRNMECRIEAAVQQIVGVLRDEVSYVACDRSIGKESSFRGNARDASDILRSFAPEESQVYFKLLLDIFGRIEAPVKLLGHSRTAICNSDVAVNGLIESLRSTRPRTRADAAKTLASMGRKATIAIPHLRQMLDDTDRLCAHRARVALEIIDVRK